MGDDHGSIATEPAEAAINAVVQSLGKIADEQRLVERARDSLRSEWLPEDLGDLAFGYDDLVVDFASCSLTFKTGGRVVSHPFVGTRLDLNVGRHNVGYFDFITLLDGSVEDTYLVIFPEFDEGGRLEEDVRHEAKRLAEGPV